MKRQNISIKQLTLGAMLTALVVVLQLVGSFIRFGPFSISLVLIPIVIGAATCGPYIGA
jgi:thiamine transporter ThiT